MIIYDKETKTFHLQTKNTSYAMCIFRDGYLSHLYWGRKLKNITSSELLVLREREVLSVQILKLMIILFH